MKKEIKVTQWIVILCLCNFNSFGQFVTGNVSGNYWGETDNNQKIEAIGIGDYSSSNVQPNAALDITIPYLFVNSPPLIYPGEAIRSTAEADFNHTWKMFTYPDKEKFHIRVTLTFLSRIVSYISTTYLNFYGLRIAESSFSTTTFSAYRFAVHSI